MAINQAPFDRFTLGHAAFGMWAGSRGFGLIPLLVMHTAWELLENAMKRRYGEAFPFASPDSVANSIGDTVAALAGWSLSLGDRLAADPWVGETNPVRLVWSPSSSPPQLSGKR